MRSQYSKISPINKLKSFRYQYKQQQKLPLDNVATHVPLHLIFYSGIL